MNNQIVEEQKIIEELKLKINEQHVNHSKELETQKNKIAESEQKISDMQKEKEK